MYSYEQIGAVLLSLKIHDTIDQRKKTFNVNEGPFTLKTKDEDEIFFKVSDQSV